MQPLVADPVRLPAVSVVIPAYNAAAHIGETLDSVRAQSFDDLEIVVVDDGSTDGTAAVVEAIDDLRLQVISQSNAGQAAARNAGLAAAGGDYVLFLDADDVLLADALAKLVAALNAAPEAVAAYGPSLSMSEDGQHMAPTRRLHASHWPNGDVLERLLEGNFLVTGSVLCRRAALQQLGGFRAEPGFRSEDWELWCRLAMLGDFAFPGLAPVAAYRVHASGRSRLKMPSDETPTIDAVFTNPELQARVPARRLRRLRRRREAQACLLCGLEATRRRRWPDARRYLMQTLWRRPMSPWALVLAPCTVLQWLPPPIAKRLVAD